MKNLIKKTEENKIESEFVSFWNEISDNLPKSFERSALGDEKIAMAVRIAYNKFRPAIFAMWGKKYISLLEIARCPEMDCDNKGTIACRISDDEWEPQQCQWCDERKQLLSTNPNKEV